MKIHNSLINKIQYEREEKAGSHTIQMESNLDQTPQVSGEDVETSRHGMTGLQKAK